MKVYLSMPISGYDIQERIDRAEKIKQDLLEIYDDVITPFDASPYDPDKSYGECMKACLSELIRCDKVVFDNGWYDSNGCRIEAEVARGCRIDIDMLWPRSLYKRTT